MTGTELMGLYIKVVKLSWTITMLRQFIYHYHFIITWKKNGYHKLEQATVAQWNTLTKETYLLKKLLSFHSCCTALISSLSSLAHLGRNLPITRMIFSVKSSISPSGMLLLLQVPSTVFKWNVRHYTTSRYLLYKVKWFKH